MCEATAYLLKNGQEELILKDVDVIEPDGDSVRIVNIFGEQKVLKAEIHSLNLINHKVILVEHRGADGDVPGVPGGLPHGLR